MSENIEILIQNGNTVYAPVVEEGVSWETERKGVPGKLTFKVVKEGELSFCGKCSNFCPKKALVLE